MLVTIDTLRADHVGAYGNQQVATPWLDRIAKAGALAWDATSHVPLTLPSHASLLTGRLPLATGIRDNISAERLRPIPTLPELLKRAGFTTGAFVSSIVLASSSGLNRGFDDYADKFEGDRAEPEFLSTVRKRGDVTTAEAITWLEERRRVATGRVFLWLHLYDPHDPYESPEPYATRYIDQPYNGAVAWSDELVGRLDQALTRLGVRDDTLLIVTSDHGEGLGDHGETLHGFFVYQSTLRVPFLMRGPGIPAGVRLGVTVRLVDVFPTVLELLGIPVPIDARLDGRSLADALRGNKAPDEPITYAESLVPLLHFGWSDLRVLREGRWKYVQAPRPELYDLATDPGEHRNLVELQASRARAMHDALGRMIAGERTSTIHGPTGPQVPPEMLERLGALGYVGAAGTIPTEMLAADPKDKIQDFRISSDLIRKGLVRLHNHEYAASVEDFRQVLARGIQGFEVQFYLAQGLMSLGRAHEAAEHFGQAAHIAPTQAAAWEGLADSLAAASDAKAALIALKQGQKLLPDNVSLRVREARMLRDQGRRIEARHAYETVLPLAPGRAQLRLELGELLRDMGQIDEAIGRQKEAVELDPTAATYWNSLGVTLGAAGHTAEAETAFRNAIARDSSDYYYAYNLGFLLLKEGRLREAREWFQKSLAINPTFAAARARATELAHERTRHKP